MDCPSPFASYLHTNHAATSEEKTQLTQFLAGPISKLAELDKEIEQAGARYDTLIEEYGKLTVEITEHKALMAPIRYLPVDIFQEIFLQCLPTTHNAVISPKSPPLLLTRVCSDWRHIALGTAALWASIHVPIPSDAIPPYYSPTEWDAPEDIQEDLPLVALTVARRRADAVTEWLGRSGACPLSITIFDGRHGTSEEIYNIVLDSLLPFCKRWGAITLDAPAARLARIVSIPANDLPLLRSLEISGSPAVFPMISDSPPQGSSRWWSDSGLVKALGLRKISYSDITEDVKGIPLQWGLLTSLELCNISWSGAQSFMTLERVAAILAMCPLLRECRVEITLLHPDRDSGGDTAARLPPVIALKHLTYLSVCARPNTPLCDLFDALQMPLLESLEVDVSLQLHSSPSQWRQLHSFLTRIGPTLRIISVDPHAFSLDQFLTCLRICSKLEHLALKRSRFSSPSWPSPIQPPPFNQENEEHTALLLNDQFLRRVLKPTFVESENEDATQNNQAKGFDLEVLVPRLTKFTSKVFSRFTEIHTIQVIQERTAVASTPGSGLAKLTKVEMYLSPRRGKSESIEKETYDLAEQGVDCDFLYSPGMAYVKYLATDGIPGLQSHQNHWHEAHP